LLRGGYVRQLASGIFTLLPLGLRSARKIERILRDEMDGIGGQELSMPVVHPADLWRETGRWYQIGPELLRFQDRNGRDMVLGMTHEEVVTDLARREIRSYKQLPILVYQIQTKFRDEPRARAGLIRVREFIMKDSYSFDADQAGLEIQYRDHFEAYFRFFHRVGLTAVVAVKSDTGMMGGKLAHEFMFVSEIGEDTLVLCDVCGYSSNLQVARFRKPVPDARAAKPLERVATPGTSTIAALAELLDVPVAETMKAVFFSAAVPAAQDELPPREVLVLALIRGDMEVNETKLANAVNARWLEPATGAEIERVGAVPGYASAAGLTHPDLLVVADDLVAASPNLIGGANEVGYHVRNVNYGRDYEASVVTDIASVYEGASCPDCGSPVRLARGVEVGNIFQLGTRYTAQLGATFLDAAGEQRPLVMGSYGIGVGRTLACVAEQHHDDRGLVLPIAVAPFEAHLVQLGDAGTPVADAAEALYGELGATGIDTLFDDRDLSAGAKFADADLIGCPIRITISARSMAAGGAEVKRRDSREVQVVSLSTAAEAVRTLRMTLLTEGTDAVRPVTYNAPEPTEMGA
jgi:prolyl-tRNA synthetase